jgi:hypothetical protein
MSDRKISCASAGPPGALPRPDWRPGGALTAGDLRLEQDYQLQRLRRHLRLVHGWGIVCGLNVVPAPGTSGWNLFVCPGYGIGPCGDEIIVPKRFAFNLSDYLWMEPVGNFANRVWISIEAEETPTAFEDVPESGCCDGCGCDNAKQKPSRLSDGFRIVVTWTAPLLRRPVFDLCSGGAPSCLPCPETCALPLALVVLPASNQPISSGAIHNYNFRGL